MLAAPRRAEPVESRHVDVHQADVGPVLVDGAEHLVTVREPGPLGHADETAGGTIGTGLADDPVRDGSVTGSNPAGTISSQTPVARSRIPGFAQLAHLGGRRKLLDDLPGQGDAGGHHTWSQG